MLQSVLLPLSILLLTGRHAAPSNVTATQLSSSRNASLWRLANANLSAAAVPFGDRMLKLQRIPERPFEASRVMLTVGAFLRKLGAKVVDADYFSVEPPEMPFRERPLVAYPLPRVAPHIRHVVRQFMRKTFGQNRRSHKDLALALKHYFANYGVCPLKTRWYDFGAKFWPRWVRLAACFNRERSCSLPPGMQCRPDRFRTIKILRYVCPREWRSHQCDWRPISFPVLVSCACSC